MIDIWCYNRKCGGVQNSGGIMSRVCLVISEVFPGEVITSLAKVPTAVVGLSAGCGGPTGIITSLGGFYVAVPARVYGYC